MNESIEKISTIMPIQKCITGTDIGDLADFELLAIILGSGTKKVDVINLASDVIRHFCGLYGVYNAGIREMSERPGMGYKKALRIHAAFELGKRLLISKGNTQIVDSPERVWKLLQPEMGCLNCEEFQVIVLDNKNKVLKKTTVSVGTVSEAIIHPREIFRDAIRELGSSIIIAHNHPSGVLIPSKEDISATRRIKEAGQIIGIELLDHVIIGALSYLSMKESGYL